MLEKYAYHRPCFILLGKYETGADRKAALKPGDAETHRDYAERLLFEFMNEIMSEHFGNSRSLSMEGLTAQIISCGTFGNTLCDLFQKRTWKHTFICILVMVACKMQP
mgnify:CR=1 FL=1